MMTLEKMWEERIKLEQKMEKAKKFTTKVKYSNLLNKVEKDIDKKIRKDYL